MLTEAQMIEANNEFDAEQNKHLLDILEGNYTKEDDTFSFELDLLPRPVKLKLHNFVSKIIKDKKNFNKEQERKRKRREAD
jgi:hypothetical protein